MNTNLLSMSILADNYRVFQKQVSVFASKYHLDRDDVMSQAVEFVCKYPYKEGKCTEQYYIKKMVCYATKDLYKKLHPKVIINQEAISRFVDLDYEQPYTENGFDIKDARLSLNECLQRLLNTDIVAFMSLKTVLLKAKTSNTAYATGIESELCSEIYSCIKTSKIGIEELLVVMQTVEDADTRELAI